MLGLGRAQDFSSEATVEIHAGSGFGAAGRSAAWVNTPQSASAVQSPLRAQGAELAQQESAGQNPQVTPQNPPPPDTSQSASRTPPTSEQNPSPSEQEPEPA